MAKLTVEERRNIVKKINTVIAGHDNDGSIRKEFFKNPNIANLRLWFDNSTIELTRDELAVVKKKATWEIVKNIIVTQSHLSGEDIIDWYEGLPSIDRSLIWDVMIMEKRLPEEYRIDISNTMLESKNPNYVKSVLEKCDRFILDGDDFWKTVLINIIAKINKNSSSGKCLLSNWQNNKHLDKISKIQGIESIELYALTGFEHYLSVEAKDIFLF